jgi:hypothetical protein
MPLSQPAAPVEVRSPLTDAIVRHRNTLWAILIVIYAFAFNGQWRVGRDSALYRGLAHSLASGQGYSFGIFGSAQILPGFPVLLAALEKVFGLSAWPGIILVQLTALGTLILTCKLVRLHFPQWLAVIVTFCVGLNGWFLELSNELLADMPFIFAMMLALYGWEWLRIAGRVVARPLVYVCIGLALAALLRPTFWVLAVAWTIICVSGLFTGPRERRRFYAISLGILALVLVTCGLIARSRGIKLFSGGYERDVIAALGKATQTVFNNLSELIRTEMVYSFFGNKWFPGMTEIMVLAVILAALLLWRINPLWPLLVYVLIAVTLVMTVVPRYYIMVLPLTMLGWFLLVMAIAQRVPPRWRELVLLLGIVAVAVPNFARDIKVIGEQRAWNRRSREEPAKWQYVLDMGEEVRQFVPPGEKVIAPGASIMSFISGRECVMHRDIIPTNKSKMHWPAHLAALNIGYAVFPSLLYDGPERPIRELMDKGVIVPVERVAKRGEVALFRVEINVPPPGKDWSKQSVTTRPVRARTSAAGTTRPSAKVMAAKKRRIAAEKRALAAHKAEVAARLLKQHRRQRQAHQQAAARAAAKARKAKAARKHAATGPSASLPGHSEVGGFSGQSVAFFSASISARLNFREPRLIPWQRLPADSQFSLLASAPSQNGQVRHCSGRAS